MDARAATALILVTMSLSLVFAAGRMSAWIVPVTGPPRAVADGQEKREQVKHPDAAPAKPALTKKPRAATVSIVSVPGRAFVARVARRDRSGDWRCEDVH